MVHILYTDISSADDRLFRALYAKAGPQRRLRADRCRDREDALRCLASGALLGFVLGTEEFEEERDPMGKPHIRGREDFRYNLSHSGPWVVLAWGEKNVGVDVQQHRQGNLEAIARRFFTPEEQEYLRRGDLAERFYRIWTGKESYGKYLGTGLNSRVLSANTLSLPEPLKLHHYLLTDGSTLALCTAEEPAEPQKVKLEELI